MNCEFGYNPTKEYVNTAFNFQSCSYGLKDGARAVGEYCPMTGKRLQNVREKGGKQ